MMPLLFNLAMEAGKICDLLMPYGFALAHGFVLCIVFYIAAIWDKRLL